MKRTTKNRKTSRKTDRDWFAQGVLLDHLDRAISRAEAMDDPAEKFLKLLDARAGLRRAENSIPRPREDRAALAGAVAGECVAAPLAFLALAQGSSVPAAVAGTVLAALFGAAAGAFAGAIGEDIAHERNNSLMRGEIGRQTGRVEKNLRTLSKAKAEEICSSPNARAIARHPYFSGHRKRTLAAAFRAATGQVLGRVLAKFRPTRRPRTGLTDTP